MSLLCIYVFSVVYVMTQQLKHRALMLYTTCQRLDFLLVFSCSGMSEMENEEGSLSNEVQKRE